ncbi:MAG: TldD/PmbA family protein [Candidatus Tectomicrobia bacterium]|uniref:TldD/PmbA family protein n=1 Tax=Tectimicrobiota bacterium TaxID=2528274 RepID=A0A932CQN9_UNCTE|nr:TldD/PmbA family protein [Candidatus Tectomicrobia bacterium]
MLPAEQECRRIAEHALGFAPTGEAWVSLTFGQGANTRFANNEITTSGASESVGVVVSITRDARTGRVSLNETSDAALERAMKRAAELARVLPPDPEYVGPLPPQPYLKIDAYDEATAKFSAADRLPGVRAVVEPAAEQGLNASGFFVNSATVQCIANQAGNFGYHRSSNAFFSATVRTADGTGSGWAEDSSVRASEVDARALAARALKKAKDSAGPTALDPGDYTVILEPAAVADFIGFNFVLGLSARAAEEGRTYFSKKGGGTLVGEKVFHPSVTLKSDPTDPRRPGSPWGGGGRSGGFGSDFGLAARPITWVEKGVLRSLSYDRYWAKKADREPTPSATNLILEGGSETLEGLIASTDRGLLVTRFWYIRIVNLQTLQLTGLTRDGLWLIENGKIVRPVVNLRFNESPAVLLNNVLGMTPAVRAGNVVVPAIKAANFTFSSLSDAV